MIDKQKDKQNKSTRVKAQMTEWQMWNHTGFNKLANIIIETIPEITKTKYELSGFKPSIIDMWGLKYKSEEYAEEHHHWPSAWSVVYFVKGSKDSPGLFFPEMGEQGGERTFEPGLLMFFPGYVKHSVRPKSFEGERYVVACNIEELKK
jgi:hypothetical protein